MAIEVKIELNDVQATIDKLGAGISNRRPLMQSCLLYTSDAADE